MQPPAPIQQKLLGRGVRSRIISLMPTTSLVHRAWSLSFFGQEGLACGCGGFNLSTVVLGALGWVSWISRAGGTFQQIPVHLHYLKP